MEVTLSAPPGKDARKLKVIDSTGFNGMAVLDPALAGSLGLSLFEIPGTVTIEGGLGTLKCRRAHVRFAVPELDVDRIVPVAVWIPQEK